MRQLKSFYDGTQPLVEKLLQNTQEDQEDISNSISHVTIQFRNYEQDKKVEMIPLMSFTTVISNIGGLTGVWLGLSAISLVEIMEKLVVWSLNQKIPANDNSLISSRPANA